MAPDDGSAWQPDASHASRRLIERYQEVAQLSRDMLAAAHREDWAEVARLETQCRQRIEGLKRATTVEPLNAIEQQRRIELLRDILRADAQIRRRAEPWLLELERLVGVSRGADPTD
jgi:flagellar protein FliT